MTSNKAFHYRSATFRWTRVIDAGELTLRCKWVMNRKKRYIRIIAIILLIIALGYSLEIIFIDKPFDDFYFPATDHTYMLYEVVVLMLLALYFLLSAIKCSFKPWSTKKSWKHYQLIKQDRLTILPNQPVAVRSIQYLKACLLVGHSGLLIQHWLLILFWVAHI